MKSGIELIAAERQKQITKHGYTSEHDTETYTEEEDTDLTDAAKAIIDADDGEFPASWTKHDMQYIQHLCDKTKIERLAIAGALIAAEIDRLQNL